MSPLPQQAPETHAELAPADPIGAVEAAIVAQLEGAFGFNLARRALKTVSPIEVPFVAETQKTVRIAPPAAYVAPLMAQFTGAPGVMAMRWAVYGVSNRATSQTRTRGGVGPFGIGSYAIATVSALALDQWLPPVEGASTLSALGLENLTGVALRDQELSVWAVTLEGMIAAELVNPGAGLADFLIFDAAEDLGLRVELQS